MIQDRRREISQLECLCLMRERLRRNYNIQLSLTATIGSENVLTSSCMLWLYFLYNLCIYARSSLVMAAEVPCERHQLPKDEESSLSGLQESPRNAMIP